MSELENSKKKQTKSQHIPLSKSHIYACFQQPQTIDILKYLTMPTPNKLLFDSAGIKNTGNKSTENEQNNTIVRKVKQFRFQRIYSRQEKFKFAFSQEISHVIEKLFKGFNQAVFIYGTQESKKDKILIGQSQNSGFLLATLSQIFQYCHEKEIEDEVTIKISCSMFKQGKFVDPFKINQNENKKQKNQASNNITVQNKRQLNENAKKDAVEDQQSMICDDVLEGKYLLGTPQIILRNMRTALKIINLLTKKISQHRESHQESTQNIIFTIKLQIDTAFDRQNTGQVYQYSIPKLYIVKLGNPSINNTLNGINKNNRWFINMFNFFQSEVLDNKGKKGNDNNGLSNANVVQAPQKQFAQFLNANGMNTNENGLVLPVDEQKDTFTQFIKSVIMQGVADIHCFTSLTNKMTSNQCLTAFIFNNYLSSYQTKPMKTILNIYKMRDQKNNFQEYLLNIFTLRETEINKEKQIMEKYRVRLGIKLGEWNNNGIFMNREKSKIKDGVLNKKIQKDSNQSLKKLNQPSSISRPSLTITNLKPDNLLIKQSFKKILSLSCDDQGEIQSIQWQVKIFLLKYIETIKQFMNCCNIVQYEYAQVLSQGCEKLNKYIFNEEVEQFFYAKKISLQQSEDLKVALRILKAQKLKILQMQQKILKRVTQSIKAVNSELQILKQFNARQQHQQLFKIKKTKLTTFIKQHEILSKIFEYYNTMSFHYIYEDNLKFIQELQKSKRKIQEQFQKRNLSVGSVNYDQIMKNIKKGFDKRIIEKKGQIFQEKDDQQTGQQANNIILEPETNQYNEKESQIKNQQTSAKENNTQKDSQRQSQKSPNDKLKQATQKALKYKMRKKEDQLDKMFTNSNVGVVRPQFHKRNK